MQLSKSLTVALLSGSALVSGNCNVAGCIGGIEGAGIASAGACAASVGTLGLGIPIDIACAASLLVDVVTAVASCSSCTVAGNCDASDAVAQGHGCGTTGKGGDLELGPSHCAQLKSSAPHDTPVFGNYVFHCDNHGLVVNQDGSTCYWPCSQCNQCTNPPPSIKGRMVEGPASPDEAGLLDGPA